MSRILVVSALQDMEYPVSNQMILQELERHFGSRVTVCRPSDLYPDFRTGSMFLLAR